MPRVRCTFAEFIRIIEAEGFVLHRHGGTSHRRYRGVVDGHVRFVDVAYHRIGDDILPKTRFDDPAVWTAQGSVPGVGDFASIADVAVGNACSLTFAGASWNPVTVVQRVP